MYRCVQWEAVKEKLQHYLGRSPQNSDLYRIVYQCRDKLERVWEERFEGTHGALRSEVLTGFDDYLNCGIMEHGAARVYCDACKHTFLVAFSCKVRGLCPSCSAKRAVMFAEHLHGTPSHHIVCTIPKRLRCYFKYDRSLNGILFKAAWGAIKEVLGSCAGNPAAVLTIQTAGEELNFHPHLHGCLADGLFAVDGTFTPFANIDQDALEKCFAERILAELQKRELLTDEVVTQILSQEHSGFSFWIGDTFDDEDSTRFVGRYIERGPVALEKIAIKEDDKNGATVIYSAKKGNTSEFDALEFLALLSTHIPQKYESLTRYYGAWSCRARGERAKKKAQELAKEAPPDEATSVTPLPSEPTPKASSSWALCMKQIYEIDPLECPKCKGQMRIISFLHDTAAIKKIMKSLAMPEYAPPPVMATGPPKIED